MPCEENHDRCDWGEDNDSGMDHEDYEIEEEYDEAVEEAQDDSWY